MTLESVYVERYRSIESGLLDRCGRFNVLIGRNNSGKSNILSSIYSFFTCIRDGNLVSLDPPIGRQDIDFFQRDTRSPMEIMLTFLLTQTERDAVIRDIITDAPQVKHAVDGFDATPRLSLALRIAPPPDTFGVIGRITLENAGSPGAKRTLLELDNHVAHELRDRAAKAEKGLRDAIALRQLLGRMDEDDWRLLRKESETASGGRPPLRYLLGRVLPPGTSSEFDRAIESLVRKSNSYPEFHREIQSLLARSQEDVQGAEREPLENKISTFAGEESSVPNYVRNILRSVAQLQVLYLTEQRKPIGAQEADRLLQLKIRRGGPERLDGIRRIVDELMGVDIDVFAGDTHEPRAEATAEIDIDDFLAEVNGSGIREALRVVLDYEFQRPRLLLVEEPEIHLHPSLETSMMEYLKRVSEDCQVFITTHSTNFLDTAEMRNVYLVSRTASTQIQFVDTEQAEIRIPKELGLRPSSFFLFDRLVFVEGPTDEEIIREWASTLGLNLNRYNIGFIHMEGARNYAHYAASSTLTFLTKRRVQPWFILDRDERDESEIERLRKLFNEDAPIKVLKKRELENYLVCPGALAKFITLKSQASGGNPEASPPAEEAVRKAIVECAEELKQLAIDKRVARRFCKPPYLSYRRLFGDGKVDPITVRIANEIADVVERLKEAESKLASCYEEQAALVESEWSLNPLAVVPGDELLQKVCSRFGVQFNKRKDGKTLAALMSRDEIDPEIREIIQDVASGN
ncbi:MAG: AAA family ATPase [Bacillota bacterium]